MCQCCSKSGSALRKFALFPLQENKDRMASCGVLQALLLLLSQGTGEEVQGAVLRLLHNLSFDETLRGHMATAGFLPKVSAAMVGIRWVCKHRWQEPK